MFHVVDSVTKRVARHISMFRNRQGLGILDHSTWCSRARLWVDHQSFKRDFVAPSQCGFRPGRRPAGFVASHFFRTVTLLPFGMYVRRHMDLLFHHAYSGFDEWHRLPCCCPSCRRASSDRMSWRRRPSLHGRTTPRSRLHCYSGDTLWLT